MKYGIIALGLIAIVGMTTLNVQAAIPLQINHQGVVKLGGVAFNGNGDFYFAFIEGSTGNKLWTNDGSQLGTTNQPSTAVILAVTQGLYSVNLGDTTLTNMVVIPSTIFNTDDVKLRIWFDDGSGAVQLSPDLSMTSAPYAFSGCFCCGVDNIGCCSRCSTTGGNGSLRLCNGHRAVFGFGWQSKFSRCLHPDRS